MCPLNCFDDDILKNLFQETSSNPFIILKASIRSPRSLRVSSVVSPNILTLFSYVSFLKLLMSFVALCCTRSMSSMSFARCGLQAWIQYSNLGLTTDLYRDRIVGFSLLTKDLFIIPRVAFAAFTAFAHCFLHLRDSSIITPKSCS